MTDYNRENKPELLRQARQRGLVGQDEEPTKQELVNVLAEDDRRQSEHKGDRVAAERDSTQQDQGGPPPPAVQVGQGATGDAASDALAAAARGDQPTSSRTGEDVADATGVGADDEELRDPGSQVGAAEGLAGAEAGNARVQEQVNAENVAGYRGINPDPTPNLNYTSEGRALDLPTPETDPDAFQAAQRALRAGGGRFPVTESGVRQAETTRQARQQVDEATRAKDDEARQAAQQ